MRIKMVIEYDGSNYHGFQIQPNANSIQETLEQCLARLTGEKIRITGAGRTDAGVHAMGQIISFDTASTIPADRFYLALNRYLPEDIRALSSIQAADDFNARFDAVKKTYRYSIYNSAVGQILVRKYALCLNEALDIEAMRAACRHIEGRHDFSSFCASGSSVRTFERTVMRCELKQSDVWLTLEMEADGFLYNMVRITVGTLLEIGRSRLSPDAIPSILQAKNRAAASPTAPPQGLCLIKVDYPEPGTGTVLLPGL